MFGEWIESEVGMSAGTSLGPLLFVVSVHDVPHSIAPKFADDMAAVVVDNDLSNVEKKLQKATDELVAWSQSKGMDINVSKTKVMFFGGHGEKLNVMIKDTFVDNVSSYKYLGVFLDSELNFTMQTDYAVGKAKRASAKICRLIDGDRDGNRIFE